MKLRKILGFGLLMVVLGFAMTACTHVPITRQITVSQNVETKVEPGLMTRAAAWKKAKDLAPYAIMAAAVYREEFKNQAQRSANACAYLTQPPKEWNDLPDGWLRLDVSYMNQLKIDTALTPCSTESGLQYEVYYKLDQQGRLAAAVLSFSGTEYDKRNFGPDWAANLSGLTFGLMLSDEYTRARENLLPLLDALAQRLPRIPSHGTCANGDYPPALDVVGHSLGGGLAQHIAYAAKACTVRRAITFNPSPVNGWMYLSWRKDLGTKDPHIDRVFTAGEVLSYLRRVTTPTNTPRFNRVDYLIESPELYQLSGMVERHKMQPLALELKKWSDSAQ